MIENKKINELKIDEYIWIIFIILSLMNIFGDECEKDYCMTHSKQKKTTSKKIFTFTIFTSLLIYLYLEYQRKKKLTEATKAHENTSIWEMRCFGGYLVIIATLLFLYCQIAEPLPQNPEILE